jgi:rhodanese-related sulfurtransferase
MGAAMDKTTPQTLISQLGRADAPLVIDVRRPPAFDADERMIVSAIRQRPAEIDRWKDALPKNRPIIVYCVHGHEVSQNAASALQAAGYPATYLEGGITGFREGGGPTRKKEIAGSTKWVTRERPKVDRIACPWLIRRFIDESAEFLYVPAEQVFAVAKETGAIPYDIPGAEPFSHVGELCSFDAFIGVYEIQDPALERLALIVRGADTSRPELTPQSPGLLALSLGLSATIPDDHAMLVRGMVMYDALYAWCASLQGEQHNWPPKI